MDENKTFRRLWISSLTDEAIREGMANLREGSGYDSLYAAADSRAKADWLVGMNASRALATASGSANNSIGRVQTPTLAMICARFKENRNFVSTPYWQLHIALKKDANCLGLKPIHTFLDVIFPQALHNIFPSLINQFIMILFGTSLLSVLDIKDLTQVASILNSQNFRTLELFTFAIGIYYIMSVICSKILRYVNNRFFPSISNGGR